MYTVSCTLTLYRALSAAGAMSIQETRDPLLVPTDYSLPQWAYTTLHTLHYTAYTTLHCLHYTTLPTLHCLHCWAYTVVQLVSGCQCYYNPVAQMGCKKNSWNEMKWSLNVKRYQLPPPSLPPYWREISRRYHI